MTVPKIDYNQIFNTQLLNWVVVNGAPALAVLAGLWVPHVWLPFVTVVIILLLILFGNYMTASRALGCALTRRYTEYALGVSALIMMVINLADTHWGHMLFGLTPHRGAIPYVPAVIIYPTLAVFTLIHWWRIGKTEYCRACAAQARSTAENTLIMGIYHTQTRYLIMFSLSLLVFESVVMLIYYFTSYINVNYNVPDKFFFFIFPITLYIISIGYVFLRFQSLRFGMAELGLAKSPSVKKVLRFIVIRGDKMLLCENSTSLPGVNFWDTPAICELSENQEIDEETAQETFASIAGTNDFGIRRLFCLFEEDGFRQTGVYAIFIPDNSEVPALHGEWLGIYAIDRLYNSGALTKQMSYDVRRIFVITMAWKTYTPDGKRLYPIKNYRPTFHLADFKNWDVDYDDLHWVDVYHMNEDRPFWRLRKFWRRYVSGVSAKWQ